MIANSQLAAIAKELETIRRLLVFVLMTNGASQADIAGALDINQSSISRMLAKARASAKAKAQIAWRAA